MKECCFRFTIQQMSTIRDLIGYSGAGFDKCRARYQIQVVIGGGEARRLRRIAQAVSALAMACDKGASGLADLESV